ncbi:MAG: hypothetical protein ACK42I_00760 [Thermomicrobium sp.]
MRAEAVVVLGRRHWLRWLGSLLLLGAVLGLPQPIIVCTCGAEIAHVHAALGFAPDHHHHPTTGKSMPGSHEAGETPSLESGDERVSTLGLTASLMTAETVVGVYGQTLLPVPGVVMPNGLAHSPESPPPRLTNVFPF